MGDQVSLSKIWLLIVNQPWPGKGGNRFRSLVESERFLRRCAVLNARFRNFDHSPSIPATIPSNVFSALRLTSCC
jgi:hypothetical protein